MPLSFHAFLAVALTGLAAAITWFMLHRVQIMDQPNARSSHMNSTPRSGGAAIVITFLAGVGMAYWMDGSVQIGQPYFAGFLAAALAVALISLFDDVTSQPYSVRLLVQGIAAASVMACGLVIDALPLPWAGMTELGWSGYVISFVWFVGLTNAYNFMDGLDGLAAGVAVIACAFLAYVAFQNGGHTVFVMSYILLAGAAGFLLFNFPPARIFMGDVGSAFLGFTFAGLAIMGARPDGAHISFLVVPLLLFNFIYDTAFTFIRRLSGGERVTEAHRMHLYQLCNRLGWSHLQVSLFQYAMCVAQGMAAVWMARAPGAGRAWIFLPFVIFSMLYSTIVIHRARQAGLVA